MVPFSHIGPTMQVDIIALHQLREDGRLVQVPVVDKLQIVPELHFVFRRFLESYVCPSACHQPNSQHLYELLPRMRAFLADPQQKVPSQLWVVGAMSLGRHLVLNQCGW